MSPEPNVIGGYGLPDGLLRLFTQAQQIWLQETLESLSAEILVKARDHAQHSGASTVILESRTGETAHTILEIAKDKATTTIIIGKRGAGEVTRLLLGSVSHKLVSLSPAPVIVVP